MKSSSSDDDNDYPCLRGFAVLEHDECDKWESSEKCSSISYQEQMKASQPPSTNDSNSAELGLKEAENTKRVSEISFLRPSKINIAKDDCERIFKKLEVFHALKKGRSDSDDGDDDDVKKVGSKKSKKSKKKHRKNDDDDEQEKSGSKGSKKGSGGKKDNETVEEEEEEEEEDEDDEDLNTDICDKTIDKEPEWNVEWRG